MNRKLTIVFIIILIFSLSACGKSFENKYDISSFSCNGILDDEVIGIKAEGFASDLCVPGSNDDLNTEGVDAEAFALFDTDGHSVISQKNLYEKVYPASTTKIMTCLLALELCDPEEYVTVPAESKIDVSGSSMADLKPGDRMKMEDMLHALMVPSGNDAAAAIAVYIGGSLDNFADMMNRRARELGATHTHFTNPHGLPDDDHYTTVYDMYLIFNEALKNEDFCRIASCGEYTASFTNSKELTDRTANWTSGNGFYNGKYTLKDGLRIVAGKTGHTNAAGFCLVLSEEDNEGKRYISIIMKSDIYEHLYDGMIKLTDKIFL